MFAVTARGFILIRGMNQLVYFFPKTFAQCLYVRACSGTPEYNKTSQTSETD